MLEMRKLSSKYSLVRFLQMTDSYVEYKIPAKELRKIAETSIYSNLDCKKFELKIEKKVKYICSRST